MGGKSGAGRRYDRDRREAQVARCDAADLKFSCYTNLWKNLLTGRSEHTKNLLFVQSQKKADSSGTNHRQNDKLIVVQQTVRGYAGCCLP